MPELTGPDDDQRRVAVLPVTSALDGLEHLVAEDTMTIGEAGRYTGLCGRRVRAPGRRCIAARDTSVPSPRRTRRRLTAWRRRRAP